MHTKIMGLLLAVLGAASACSCSRTHTGAAAESDWDRFESIAAIDPNKADHVRAVLKQAGIESIIEGSVYYGVSVAPGKKGAAIELLKQDSARLKYLIQFIEEKKPN